MDSDLIIIVQARYSSSRLPGKMLLPIAGITLIDRVMDRLLAVRNVKGVIVATSDDPTDDILCRHCDKASYPVFRGSLNNVADRFSCLLKQENAAAFVRISGDSPLVDPALISRCVDIYRVGDFDIVSNIVSRSFPKGQSVEVVDSKTFLAALPRITSIHDIEHVTQFFYRRPAEFKIHSVTREPALGDMQLSVDTLEDAHMIERIIKRIVKLGGRSDLETIVRLRRQLDDEGAARRC